MNLGPTDDPSELLALVSRIEARDRAAENEFASRFWRGVYLILYRDCKNPELSSDLTQETLMTALQKMRYGDLKKPESLKSFVRAIARNKLIAYKRKEANQRTDSLGERIFELSEDATGLLDNLHEEQIRALMHRLIGELTVDRDRELLFRAYVYGQDKSLICKDLDISPDHYDRVSYRARQRLKQLVAVRIGDSATTYCGIEAVTLLLLVSALSLQAENPPATRAAYSNGPEPIAQYGGRSPLVGSLSGVRILESAAGCAGENRQWK